MGLAAALIENLSLSENSDDDVAEVEDGLASVLMLCSKFAGLNLSEVIPPDL